MEFIGVIACIYVLIYIDVLQDKIEALRKRIGRIEGYLGFEMEGGFAMSKMLEQLKGQGCIIKVKVKLLEYGSSKIKCRVIDVDDEWMKLELNTKSGKNIRIIRIDDIAEVQTRGN